MSLIGNRIIKIPENVNIKFEKDNFQVEVSGPRGVLVKILKGVNIENHDGNLSVSVDNTIFKQNELSKMHGLYHVLVENMVIGVSVGFKKCLDLIGKGYKATLLTNNIVEFDLGFSHKVLFCIPKEVKFEITVDKTKNVLTISGNDKCLVGQISAKIRALRPVEPYKGKGFRYSNEFIKLKVGKKVK